MDYLEQARGHAPEWEILREAIHRQPELGNQEYHTAALVEQRLQSFGIRTERLLDTAVVGTLDGALPGKCAALRADLDALPLQETSGAAFASACPNIAHACGHDVHTAAVLGAAELLAANRTQLHGRVKFFFQPDEEGSGGAQRMIAAGCMQDVDAVFGAHVCPDLPFGTVGIRYGKFYAASDTFTIRITGRSCHGAQPECGIDALACAARLVSALHALGSPDPFVLSVGTLHAGTAINVIAGQAELTGILRTLGAENRAAMKQAIRKTAEAVCAQFGASAEVTLHESYMGVVNSERETALVERSATALLGAEHVKFLDAPTMTTEDFGYFIDAAAGSFYHIGVGGSYPLHHPSFLPPAEAVPLAAALHAAVVTRFLQD